NYIAVQAIINTSPTISLGPDTIHVFNSTILNPGSGFTAYSWSTTETTPTITVTNSGSYCVTVTASTNCTATDCIFVDVTVGINEIHSSFAVDVYPNPSAGKISLQFLDEFNRIHLSVYNSTGALINEQTLKNVNSGMVQELDLSAESAGVYFIRFESEKGNGTRYIIRN
ncbi:MAG TPA: T9SS type A sorting domain-containing protein, partial [Bacteroidia bacterium]|nr:T9SS type A sorting domain-containing protein [Bacteroidia bacterium]